MQLRMSRFQTCCNQGQFWKRSTRKRRPKHKAPKSRKRSTQNSKPVCPLKTRQSLVKSPMLTQQRSSTITNRMQFKTIQVELRVVANAIPSPWLLAILELHRALGRVSYLNEYINWHHRTKGHVEIGYLTKFGALRLNRDQVMTLETWLKIHTNFCSFVTASPK